MIENKHFKVIKLLYFNMRLYYVILDKEKLTYYLIFMGHNMLDLDKLKNYFQQYNNVENYNFDEDIEKGMIDMIFNRTQEDYANEVIILEFDNLDLLPSIAVNIEDSLVDLESDKEIMSYKIIKEINNMNNKIYKRSVKDLQILLHAMTIGNNIDYEISLPYNINKRYTTWFLNEKYNILSDINGIVSTNEKEKSPYVSTSNISLTFSPEITNRILEFSTEEETSENKKVLNMYDNLINKT